MTCVSSLRARRTAFLNFFFETLVRIRLVCGRPCKGDRRSLAWSLKKESALSDKQRDLYPDRSDPERARQALAPAVDIRGPERELLSGWQ